MNSKAKTQEKIERNAKCTINTIYDGPIFHVLHEEISYNHEKKVKRDLVTHSPAVAILAVDEKKNILFVEQYRRAIDKILLELPAGMIDENEEPIDAAKRELDEETGFRAKTFTYLGGCYSSPGFCNEYIHLFLAEDLSDGHLEPDEDEAIDLVKLSEKEILEKLQKGAFHDAKTLAALLYYFQKRLQLKEHS